MRNHHLIALTVATSLALGTHAFQLSNEEPGAWSYFILVKSAQSHRRSSDNRMLPPVPREGFPASRADEGPDDQGSPPMPDVDSTKRRFNGLGSLACDQR